MTPSGEILKKFKEKLAQFNLSAKQAREAFRKAATYVKDVSGNKILSSAPMRLFPQNKIYGKHTGRMIMYFYDPKLKKELPYYDTFPLGIILQPYFVTPSGKKRTDGFLSLNLHYLPINLRAKLLDALYTVYKDQHLDERKKLAISYNILKSSSRFRWFRPCIKVYLYKHVRSKFFIVPPDEWDLFIALPTERFQKASKETVWQESKRKIRTF